MSILFSKFALICEVIFPNIKCDFIYKYVQLNHMLIPYPYLTYYYYYYYISSGVRILLGTPTASVV